MSHFKLTLTQYYLAVASVIATFLIQRPLVNSQWDSTTALTAGITDLTLIAVLVCLYLITVRLAPNDKALARKVSNAIHVTAASLILIIAILSQLLFLKTGETLDIGIIDFALRHASALAPVVAGEVSLGALEPILFAVVIVVLASLQINRPRLRHVTQAVIAVPILLLPGCDIAEGLLIEPAAPEPVATRNDSLYKGLYADLTETQMTWNSSGNGGWSSGIVSGMLLDTAFGRLEYEGYKAKAGADEIYRIDTIKVDNREPRPNVLLILLESVRYDAVGVYRQGQDIAQSVTPFIDEFARHSQVVERAYTTIPHTSKALVGIYCGTFPRFEPEITEGLPGGLSIPCLPALLKKAGYASAHFQTAPARFENRDQLLRNMGFTYFTTQENYLDGNWERFGYLGLDDRAMIGPAVSWMEHQQQQNRPFFASMLTVATHHPYASPGNIKPISNPQEGYNAYLTALLYTDAMLRDLFAELERKGLLKNTLVIITGDHGEGFGEHGQVAHNGTAYEEGMRVPLIIRTPSQSRNTPKIGGLRQHIDIAPTILEAAGIHVKGALPGLSLLTSPQGHRDILTSCFYEDYCLTHIDDRNRKLIYLYGRRDAELYDLVADPNERSNLLKSDSISENEMEERLIAAIRLRNSYAQVWH